MDTTKRRTLNEAATTLGGESALARALDVSVELVRYYLRGIAEIPDRAYLAALHIVKKA